MFLQLFCLALLLANRKNSCNIFAELLPSSSELVETVIKSWYPDDIEFNESCVSEGCPSLTNFSLCPNDINISVLHSVLDTAIGCMKKPICGIVMDYRPTPAMTATTEELLPSFEIDGKVSLLPGTGYLSNVSNIEFEIVHSHHQTSRLPIHMTMHLSNIQCCGHLRFDLKFRQMLPSVVGQALTITIPQAKYNMEVEFVSTMSINHSITSYNYNIRLQNPMAKIHPMFCGIEMPDGFPSILTLLTTMTQTITEKSSWAVRIAALLEKYFQSAIRSVSNSC